MQSTILYEFRKNSLVSFYRRDGANERVARKVFNYVGK